MSKPKIDTVIEELQGLSKTVHVVLSSMDGFKDDIGEMKTDIKDLNVKVGIQNGSVKDLKEDRNAHAKILAEISALQSVCPGALLMEEYHGDKEKNAKNPVVIIINNWKLIGAIVGVSVILVILFPLVREFAWDVLRSVGLKI